MNDYEQKKADRIDRMRDRADKAAATASRRLGAERSILGHIPMGQPVLVGHHSEKRHRRDLARADAHRRAGYGAQGKAANLRARADAAESSTAVSSDDPEAVTKLKEKIDAKEKFRDECKRVNALIRAAKTKAKKAGLPWEPIAIDSIVETMGYKRASAKGACAPDYGGRHGIPSYVLTNCGAEIRRLKKRLASLSASAARDGREEQIGAVRLVEEENRVRLFFPDKPTDDIRTQLKSHGFRWARSIQAWQRHASNGAWHHARRIATSGYPQPSSEAQGQ